MSKISSDHSSRAAYVYVRQSTGDQLVKNPESRRRQYALAARARTLGWSNVVVIDDDLGRSGGGMARPGFDRLLAAICTGAAGAVFAIEASRLARNGRDWHTLLEFCALVHCLIIDEDGVYDPKQINDRLLLGMKGTFSEMELSIFRQRSQEALRLKAARGDLHTSVAVGYIRGLDDRLELDPDKRVRVALDLAFRKFAEFGSARQVALWLVDEDINMPVAAHGAQGRVVERRAPRYNTIHRLLTNPIYAGAYAFGRTGSQTRVGAGRKAIKRGIRRTPDAWRCCFATTTRVTSPGRGAARGRERIHPGPRRAERQAARVAVGQDRQALPLRGALGCAELERPLGPAPAVDRPTFHVRARLGEALQELLVLGRRL